MGPLLIHDHGVVSVGPAIVQAADLIKFQNYKTNTPKNFQVQPLHTEEAAALMQELADRVKVSPDRLDFVYFSVCRGAEEHTDLLDPNVFEPRTFVIPVILPQGNSLIVAKGAADSNGVTQVHSTFVQLNHVYEFDHEKPHSMHLEDTESGCVVIMVALKKEIQNDNRGTASSSGGSPQGQGEQIHLFPADVDLGVSKQGD